MLKIARKYPILFTCGVVAAASLCVAMLGAALGEGGVFVFAFAGFNAACGVAIAVLSYNVFGGRPNSSIHGPGAGSDDAPR
jgi:hypothetical protein